MGSLTGSVLGKIKVQGREYFHKEESIPEIEALLNEPQSIQELIKGLNFVDTGMKQPCTALALILKIGKKHPAEAIKVLKNALKNDGAPTPYLCELIYKIHKSSKINF